MDKKNKRKFYGFISFSLLFMFYLCRTKIIIELSNRTKKMKKLGILTAMSVEYNQLAQLMENRQTKTIGMQDYLLGNIGTNEVILLQCGIGKVNAAMGVTLLIDRFQPNAIISTGVAGGIDNVLHVMDVVVSTQTVYHDMWCGPGNVWGQVQGLPERLDSSSEMLEVARSINGSTHIHTGLICTGDLFVSKDEEQQRIKALYPEALAVDMESCAIAQVCFNYNIPFISFRIISDTPGHADNVSQYLDFWGEMAKRSFGVTKAFISRL